MVLECEDISATRRRKFVVSIEHAFLFDSECARVVTQVNP